MPGSLKILSFWKSFLKIPSQKHQCLNDRIVEMESKQDSPILAKPTPLHIWEVSFSSRVSSYPYQDTSLLNFWKTKLLKEAREKQLLTYSGKCGNSELLTRNYESQTQYNNNLFLWDSLTRLSPLRILRLLLQPWTKRAWLRLKLLADFWVICERLIL